MNNYAKYSVLVRSYKLETIVEISHSLYFPDANSLGFIHREITALSYYMSCVRKLLPLGYSLSMLMPTLASFFLIMYK